MKKYLMFLLILSFVLIGQEKGVVIANLDVDVSSVTKFGLKRIYLGQKKFWTDGNPVIPIMLSDKKAKEITKRFFNDLLNTSARKYKKGWLKLTFSGNGSAPKRFKSVKKLILYVAETSGAVGFIPLKDFPKDGSVKKLIASGKSEF